ncbi:unnamed protein product [Parajaminaea phylloscopi]
MARLPTISARPTPKRRHVSSSSAAAGPSSTAAGSHAPTQVTKAAKKAAKRKQMLQGPRHPEAMARSLLAQDDAGQLSKSALRRRKRKVRDQAVLGRTGMGVLKDQLDDLDGSEERDQDDDVGGEASAALELEDSLDQPVSLPEHEANRVTHGSKVGEKLRKRVLAQEQLRQPHILKDLHHSDAQATAVGGRHERPSAPSLSGFAAIRQHAKNTLGLSSPAVGHGGKRDGDVTMS